MRLRPKLNYANVMVTLLAVVVLFGGAAYAAGRLGRNSVGTRQLKKNAVTSAKVKDHSLKARDLAAGVLPGTGAPSAAPAITTASHGHQASGSVNYDQFSSSTFGSTVVTLNVPPGAYYATASIAAQTVNGVESTVQCRLVAEGSGGPTSGTTGDQDVRKDGSLDNFTLTALISVSQGQALALDCSKTAAESSARITKANVVAVQVTDISGFNE